MIPHAERAPIDRGGRVDRTATILRVSSLLLQWGLHPIRGDWFDHRCCLDLRPESEVIRCNAVRARAAEWDPIDEFGPLRAASLLDTCAGAIGAERGREIACGRAREWRIVVAVSVGRKPFRVGPALRWRRGSGSTGRHHAAGRIERDVAGCNQSTQQALCVVWSQAGRTRCIALHCVRCTGGEEGCVRGVQRTGRGGGGDRRRVDRDLRTRLSIESCSVDRGHDAGVAMDARSAGESPESLTSRSVLQYPHLRRPLCRSRRVEATRGPVERSCGRRVGSVTSVDRLSSGTASDPLVRRAE